MSRTNKPDGKTWQCAICDYSTDSTEDFADHWDQEHER